MGATDSAFTLKINLQKTSFIPGEIINGSFNFDFKDEEKKLNFQNNKVTISILSLESTHKHSKKLEYILTAETLSIPQLFEINENPNIKIPFQIKIPINANPSFEWYRSNDNKYAYLRNFLKIEIPEIKTEKSIFIIIKKISTPLNSSLDLIEHSHRKRFFSFDDITLNVKYNTNSFPLKSIIPFTFIADFSQSKYNIKAMQYTLKRKIKFFEKDNILEEVIDELQQKRIQGNMTKEQTENFVAYLCDSKEIYKNYYKDKSINIDLKPNEIINLMPNIKANLFECEYYIKVKAITDKFLFSSINPPSMYVPLDVFQPYDNDEYLNIRRQTLNLQPSLQQLQQPILDLPNQQSFLQPIMRKSTMENSSMQQSYMQLQLKNSSLQKSNIFRVQNKPIKKQEVKINENEGLLNKIQEQNELDMSYKKEFMKPLVTPASALDNAPPPIQDNNKNNKNNKNIPYQSF